MDSVENSLRVLQERVILIPGYLEDLENRTDIFLMGKLDMQTVKRYNIKNLEIIEETGEYLKINMRRIERDINESVSSLVGILHNILRGLAAFRDAQRLVVLGKEVDISLDHFEQWFRTLNDLSVILEESCLPKFNLLCENRVFASDVSVSGVGKQIVDIRNTIKKSSLVMQTQPKQINGIINLAGMKLRFLPWSTDLKVTSIDSLIIVESTAKEVCKMDYNHDILPKGIGKFSFKRKKTGKDRKQKNIYVYSKRAEDMTTEEKKHMYNLAAQNHLFHVYFRVQIRSGAKTETLWALSLPFWITMDSSFEANTWSQLIWHNSADEYSVNEVRWSNLIDSINQLFIALGRKLSAEQRAYFKETLFGEPNPADEMVTKAKFCFDAFSVLCNYDELDSKYVPTFPIRGSERSISFGEWIYFCWDILGWKPKPGTSTGKELRHYWVEGKIIGFMSTLQMQRILRDKPIGTFIIRFPEEMPGFIGLYVYDSFSTIKVNGRNEMLSKKLLSSGQFAEEPFENGILEMENTYLNTWTYLYSNFEVEGNIVHKERAFDKVTNNGPVTRIFPARNTHSWLTFFRRLCCV